MYIAEVKEKLPTNQYRADYFTIQYFFDVGNSLISIKCFTNYIYGNCWILTKNNVTHTCQERKCYINVKGTIQRILCGHLLNFYQEKFT